MSHHELPHPPNDHANFEPSPSLKRPNHALYSFELFDLVFDSKNNLNTFFGSFESKHLDTETPKTLKICEPIFCI
jgi:hypothetical protein